MFTIRIMRDDEVLSFAAQELKEYLLMMMPEGGCAKITHDTTGTDGFRLGLLEDFGLENPVEDPVLDDIVHIDTDENGGILAGSNPRSVLFAVYRLLKENGARFLYPGVDGEYIPLKQIEGVQYHKVADHRLRGFCDEGCEYQESMLGAIDFYAKLELNAFMVEWFVPNGYYNRYYTHMNNPTRVPEGVTDETIIQWRRQCEIEVNKRGLVLAAVGHGWTARPFGFPASNSVNNIFEGLDVYTEEQKSMLALRNGTREFFRKAPLFTNVCMSQDWVRTRIAEEVANYAELHPNYTFIRVSLADGNANHCECPECSKMRPADWYLRIQNEINEKLTAKGLKTRITFSAYVDTFFPPEHTKIENPSRFAMSYAPISRDYASSIGPDSVIPPTKPYIRNAYERPTTTEECFAYMKEWRNVWKGTVFTFEYHFWRHQFLDPGVFSIGKRIYEDVRSLKYMDINGYIEDGSQRSCFPNAFLTYLYAATLMDREVEFDAVVEDYFSHIYGKDWEKVVTIMKAISKAFDFAYMEGIRSVNPNISKYYDPERAPRLDAVHDLASQTRHLASKHPNMPTRPQTISWRLLALYADFCDMWADIMKAKALGHNFKAKELAKQFYGDFGKHEVAIERYYDHGLATRVLEHITAFAKGIIFD